MRWMSYWRMLFAQPSLFEQGVSGMLRRDTSRPRQRSRSWMLFGPSPCEARRKSAASHKKSRSAEGQSSTSGPEVHSHNSAGPGLKMVHRLLKNSPASSL